VNERDELDELDGRRPRRRVPGPVRCSEILTVKVPPTLAYRAGLAAAATGLSVGEWMRRAMIGELARAGM
jgi:predicted HicB family RNase H-like nuclease